MNDEEQWRRRFEEMDFPGEPAMASTPFDDARRGRRRLRQRRAATVTAGLAAVALVTAGVGYLLPSTGAGTDTDLQVAGGPSTPGSTPEATAQQTPEPTGSGGSGPVDSGSELALDFPRTRQLLLDTAMEHLDPQGRHLPEESTNLGTSGGGEERDFRVSTKLGWTNPGEDGEGMVFVAVTTPEFTGDGWFGGDATFESMTGCADASTCTEQSIPGSPGRAWVAEADPERDFELGVIYERPDGVLVGIGVYDLFGNNSTTPVSEVDIDLEDAFAFVTDPDLRVYPDEAAAADPHIRATKGASAAE